MLVVSYINIVRKKHFPHHWIVLVSPQIALPTPLTTHYFAYLLAISYLTSLIYNHA